MMLRFYFLLCFCFIVSFYSSIYSQNHSQKVQDTTQEKEDFQIVRQVPHPISCEVQHEDQQKRCFSEYLAEYIAKKFDRSKYLYFLPGKYRYNAQFKVNTKGFIEVTSIKGPRDEPKEDIVALLESVPQMNPGIIEDKPVSVVYGLPINFIIPKHKKNKKARKNNRKN